MPGAVWVGLAAALFVAIYWELDLNKLYGLAYGWDNGIFLQSLAHVMKDGSAFNWAEGQSHWYVHDSWLLLVLAPLAKFYPYQETMVAIQLLLTAGAAFTLYGFARTIGVEQLPAALVAIAYLISPSVQGFAYNEFSETHFEPILIFALAIAVARRSFWGTLLCTQALMGVKEDMGIFLIWFGIAGAIWYDRRLGLSVAALAALNTIGYYGVLALHGSHPGSPPFYFLPVYPLQDAAFLLEILAPFAFAPLLLRWRVLIALPMLAELFLGDYHADYPLARAGVHYTQALVALVALGAVIAIRRRPRLAVWSLACSCVMALFFNTTVLHFGRHLYSPDWTAVKQAHGLVHSQEAIVFTNAAQARWALAAADLNARVLDRARPRVLP